jgi:hypothetical protein
MTSLKPEIKFCAFLDVLGYGDIVMSVDRSTDKKVEMLDSVFSNLQSSISHITLKRIKEKYGDKQELYVKSFSDCVFIQSDEPYTILFSLYNIFTSTFGYYTNFNYNEHCTVLLRGGVIKDWTLKIMDLGSLTRGQISSIAGKEEMQNIIGLGVARAYYTSEKSGLSGMRIIISPEVLESFILRPYTEVPFECYFIEGDNLLYSPELESDIQKVKLFFLPVRENEKGNTVNLYELCWPVYKYSFSDNKTDIHTFINEVIKIEPQYDKDNIRHLRETAKLLYKSFEIAMTIDPTAYPADEIKSAKDKLKSIYEAK